MLAVFAEALESQIRSESRVLRQKLDRVLRMLRFLFPRYTRDEFVQRMRENGLWRFVIVYGVFRYGLICASLTLIGTFVFLDGRPAAYIAALIFLPAGAVWALAAWGLAKIQGKLP